VPAAGGRQREPEKLLPGTRVRVYSMGREGYLLSAPDRSGRVEVQVGILRTSVPAADVIPAEEPVQQGTAGTGPGAMMMHKAQEVSPEVHVRGLTVDEALEVLGKYIDDAVLAGLKTARVIHGKGTGTLRRAVAEYLRQHPQVENFHLADQAEGGEGATVMTLK
ncbi:MAG TPA: endonuclease MutS2, partial [Firmicutes bacterium]|nr:endonuclease MutS2 [Bacillota bacterium]